MDLNALITLDKDHPPHRKSKLGIVTLRHVNIQGNVREISINATTINATVALFRVADLLCYFLKFKVAVLLGADLLCTLKNHVLNNTYLDTIPINFQDEVLG